MKQWTETLVSSDWVDIGGLIFNRVDVSFFFSSFFSCREITFRALPVLFTSIKPGCWRSSESCRLVDLLWLCHRLCTAWLVWQHCGMSQWCEPWCGLRLNLLVGEKKGKRERGSRERKWLMGKMKSNFLYTKQPPEEKRRPCSPLTGDVSPSVWGFAASLFYFSS